MLGKEEEDSLSTSITYKSPRFSLWQIVGNQGYVVIPVINHCSHLLIALPNILLL